MTAQTSAKTILVTGGAGYIGSHTIRQLEAAGLNAVVLDNLVYGHAEALEGTSAKLVEGDLADRACLDRIFNAHDIDTIMHFAAYAYVGESVTDPAKYYLNNTAASLNLLEAMRAHNCRQFIFSSTCATYGNPNYMPLDERHPQSPVNPYGWSKFMLEQMLRDYDVAYGFRSVFLRYFNASGAAQDGSIGEDHDPETHLIPLVLDAALGRRDTITVFGTDYDTPDGTCIRDYIHVDDLARAHLKALDYLREGKPTIALNLGTGKGASVKEIIDCVRKVSGKEIPVRYGDRRAGDPPELVAAPTRAKSILGWEAEIQNLEDIITTAWKWASGPRQGHY